MPELILRLVEDASSVFKTNAAVVSSMTKVGVAANDLDADFKKAAAGQVASSLKVERSLKGQIAAYRELSTSATASAAEQAKATQLGALASERLARSQGLVVASSRGLSTGAKTAENDLGKLTRGALAGSGVISSLGRSLAFASGGFIAVAGTATLLHNAIAEALDFAATEKQVTAQLKTSGLSFEENKTQILDNLTAQSKLSAFTRGDLLQSFGYLVRVSGNVDQSLKLTAVAADVARGRHIALSAASIALAKALGGSSTALRRLGIIVPKTATGMEAIRFVAAKFAGQAEAGATSADHLRAGLVNAGEVIGTSLLPTFNRLVTEFGDYITKLQASGRLQKDANEAVTIFGYAFHTLGGIIKAVDRVTGGFVHTLELLIALELGSKIYGWAKALNLLAGQWFLVGRAATAAGVAQSAALAETGAASGVAGASGGAAGTGLIGGLLASRFAGRFRSAITPAEAGGARFAIGPGGVATDLAAGGVAGAAISATGVGALAVAALLATKALGDLAKSLNDAAGGGHIGDSIIGGIEGVLTGGLVGDSKFGILPEIFNRKSPFRTFLSPLPPPPPPAYLTHPPFIPPQFQAPGFPLGGTGRTGPFGTAQPMTQYWKQFTKTFKQMMDEAQAALTKSNADDVAAARQEVARIKKGLAEGIFHGPALFGALQAEANDLSIIWSAEAAAAQARAAKAAAAKQKIITQIQNAIDPIKLEVALSRALSLGQSGIPQLKDLLAAAYKGLAKALASGNQQLIKQAYDQIKSVKDSIQAAQQTATATFQASAKLLLDIARDQALGKPIEDDLREEKKALLRWISSHRKNIQGVTDAYNQITAINQQLAGGGDQSFLGLFKQASTKALTSNLNLTEEQRRKLRARLSQLGPGGTLPGDGTGAFGYAIDPATGRPTARNRHRHQRVSDTATGAGSGGRPNIALYPKFEVNVYVGGDKVEATVTKRQQRRSQHNPNQRRGPQAGR